jgi:hypothetical protein
LTAALERDVIELPPDGQQEVDCRSEFVLAGRSGGDQPAGRKDRLGALME